MPSRVVDDDMPTTRATCRLTWHTPATQQQRQFKFFFLNIYFGEITSELLLHRKFTFKKEANIFRYKKHSNFRYKTTASQQIHNTSSKKSETQHSTHGPVILSTSFLFSYDVFRCQPAKPKRFHNTHAENWEFTFWLSFSFCTGRGVLLVKFRTGFFFLKNS